MTDKRFIFDPENKIDCKYGNYMVFGSVIGFGIINVIVTNVGKPRQVKTDAWRWNNLLISWLHALICGTWDFLCLILYPELMDDLVNHINYFTYLMTALSTGYFIYDFLDLLFRQKILANWEVTLHHIAVASMFYYNVAEKMCIGFNVLALMAEINSIFLHSRKLLHFFEFDLKSHLYKAVCYANLVTFFFCRTLPLIRITYALFTQYDLVPLVYYVPLCLSIGVMNAISPVLFWRLFKNDVLRNLRTSSRQEEKEKSLLNGNNNQTDHIKSN